MSRSQPMEVKMDERAPGAEEADATRAAANQAGKYPYRIERQPVEGEGEKWVILANADDSQVGDPYTFHNAAASECGRLNLASVGAVECADDELTPAEQAELDAQEWAG